MTDDEWDEVCDLFDMALEPIDGYDADAVGPHTDTTGDRT